MITDDDLLVYQYDDGLDANERRRIGAALSAQPELAARLKALVAQLDAVADVPEVAVPVHAQQRWQASLERAAQQERPAGKTTRHSLFADYRWGMGAAAFAVVLFATSVGLRVFPTWDQSPDTPSAIPTQIATAPVDASRYERGLQWHLAQTEQQLAGLSAVSGEERTRLIDKVIVQNRLYAIAADRANEARLARVLRSFTPILESLADDRTAESEFAGGLAQLNFELKVMQARLATAAPTAPGQVLAL